jgi:hypothetical protein
MIKFAAYVLTALSVTGMHGELSMNISFTKTTFVLGEPIPAEVVYSNTAKATVNLPDPSQSLDVIMHVVNKESQEDLNYTMGEVKATVLDSAADQYALDVPVVPEIKISAASEFRFDIDLNSRLYLRPGEFDCFLTDPDGESNHMEIVIEYTKTSVDYLIPYAMDQNQTYGRREWAMEWIQKIYPNFDLKLPDEETGAEQKVQFEKYNNEKYNEFLAWWESYKDKIDIKQSIKNKD